MLLKRLMWWLHRIEDSLTAVILLAMIALAVVEIVLRNFFSISLTWIDPLLRNGVLWIALLGTMIASRRDEQIRIDVASHYLPKPVQRWLSVLLDFVTAGICLAIAWFSATHVLTDVMEYEGLAFGAVPAWLLQIIIPIGFISIGTRYFVLFVLNLLGRRPEFYDQAEQAQ